MPGLLGKHSLWPWAQAWLFTSMILVHLLQPQEAVREEADCCLLTTFWLELPFFSRIKTRMETALFHRWEN